MQSNSASRCAAAFVLTVAIALSACADGAPRVSKPFAYSGYTEPEYTGVDVRSTYVPMSDGVQLAVDMYLPKDGPARDAFPVILEYTPYQRSRIDPATGQIRDERNAADCNLFVSHGYVFVRADMRGTGASSGWVVDFMPRLGEDGKELIDWIAEQPWCNGKVGMKGASYLGWSQTATATFKPKALKCIMPTAIPLDGFSGEVYPGGIYLQGFMQGFSEYMGVITHNCYFPDGGARPTKPAADEDGDGEWADEIPEYDPNTGSFLDGAPVYADGAKRNGLYFNATRDHLRNYDYNEWASRDPVHRRTRAARSKPLRYESQRACARCHGFRYSHLRHWRVVRRVHARHFRTLLHHGKGESVQTSDHPRLSRTRTGAVLEILRRGREHGADPLLARTPALLRPLPQRHRQRHRHRTTRLHLRHARRRLAHGEGMAPRAAGPHQAVLPAGSRSRRAGPRRGRR